MQETSGPEPADSLAEARAAQILAEMLAMVCHPEYFRNPPRDQTVKFSSHFSDRDYGIVLHFDGFHVFVYFATFPSEYLHTVRNVNVNVLNSRETKAKLNHTKRYNLFNTEDRTEFIKEFVALVRFVAAG